MSFWPQSDQLLKLTGIVTKRQQRCTKSVWLFGATALVSQLPVLRLYSFWIPFPNTSQFCSSPGVPSDINQVLLPLRPPKVSISLCCPFRSSFPPHVHLSIRSSAQSEGWSCRAALYLCSNWPGGKPEVRLLPSHHQHTHLPLHSQVHLCKVVKWFPPKGEILWRIRVNLFLFVWLSYLPWFEVFYKLLNNLADYLKKGQVSRCGMYEGAVFDCFHNHEIMSKYFPD